jgi:hypothetical protein
MPLKAFYRLFLKNCTYELNSAFKKLTYFRVGGSAQNIIGAHCVTFSVDEYSDVLGGPFHTFHIV